jgi:hypothetical protein
MLSDWRGDKIQPVALETVYYSINLAFLCVNYTLLE